VLPTINVSEDKWLNQPANAMLGWPKQLRPLPDGIRCWSEPITDK